MAYEDDDLVDTSSDTGDDTQVAQISLDDDDTEDTASPAQATVQPDEEALQPPPGFEPYNPPAPPAEQPTAPVMQQVAAQAADADLTPPPGFEPFGSPVQAADAETPPPGFAPFNPPEQPRGIIPRITEGYKGGVGEAPFGPSLEEMEKSPVVKALSPLGAGLDIATRVPMGIIGGIGGAVAGIAEKLGMSPQEADRLQRETPGVAAAFMTEPFMGEAGAIRQGQRAGTIPDPTIAREAPKLPPPEPVVQPGVKNQAWTGPPAEVPAPPPPEQPALPGLGGGDRQPQLPLEPPAAKPAPMPELPLEPPPVINKEGQYGFNITAPDIHSRSAMPDSGGVAKEAVPPAGRTATWPAVEEGAVPKEPDAKPHTIVGEGLGAQAAGKPSESGINVMQPGQVDPTLTAGLKAAATEAPKPPPETPTPPGPYGQALDVEAPRMPPGTKPLPLDRPQRTQVATGLTQGAMPEPPVPTGHTRLYQGENAPPREFTADKTAAARAGAVSHVDVPNEQLPQQFKRFGDTQQYTGSKLWESPKYRERLQKTEPMLTGETRATPGERPPAASEPPPAPPAAEPPPTPKMSTPKLDAEITKATAPKPVAPEPVAKAAPKPLEGEILPPEKPAAKSVSIRDSTGKAHAAPVKETTTYREALDKYGTQKGLIPKLTKFVANAVKDIIGDLPVHIVPKEAFDKIGHSTTVGLYSREHNHIILNEKYLHDASAMKSTVLHEGIHGVTSHALITNVPLRDTVHSIMLDTLKALKAGGKNALPEGTHYGFTGGKPLAFENFNAREFIAEAFSNPKFQRMLKALKVSPETAKAVRSFAGPSKITSAWDAIVNTVRGLLKLPASEMSALEAAMRMTEHAMKINEGIKEPYMKDMKAQLEKMGFPAATSDPMVAPSKGEVIARDKFGNEIRFVGATVHEAAIKAKAAGYKQIFNTNNTPYVPPKVTPTPTPTPATATKTATPTPTATTKPATPATKPASTLVPATKSDLKTGLLASLRRNFIPMVSKSAQVGAAALREASGPLARLRAQTQERFTNEMHRLANNMTPKQFENFVNAYESGKASSLPPEQRKLAMVLEKNYGEFWNEIKKLPGTAKMDAVENYLVHMYDNSKGQVNNFVSDWYGGGGGSLKERTHPTFADAKAAGLTPLSSNPIEHFARYSEGLSHHLAQRMMMEDIKDQGRLGYFGPKTIGASGTPEPLVKGQPPDGYAKIEAPWAKNNKTGQSAYAPRDIAETINQFYNAGLQRAQTKDIYNFLQQTKNAWTAVELGLSAYHATTMSVESVASGMSRALQMAGSGNFKGATAQLLKSPVEPVTSYLYGREGRKLYQGSNANSRSLVSRGLDVASRAMHGDVNTPLSRKIMDTLTKANIQPGNLKATGEYDMSRLGNFWDSYKRGSLPNEFMAQLKAISDSKGLAVPGVLIDNVRRAMQTISKPLFEHYIPELKLGTMMKDMEAWYKANPKATDAEALAYARKVADSIDNRMGEMNMDNLFMNKTAKQLGTLTLRSFGFTVGGPFREIGAGIGGLAKTAIKGENPLKNFDLRSKNADPRAAYAMAFFPAIAFVSALYQGLKTGTLPDDWHDIATPKTGGTVKSLGKQVPERALTPGYNKDFLGYFVNPEGPAHELYAKVAVPWTTMIEQLVGKDWRDKAYVPPRPTSLEWLKAHGGQALSHVSPIGPKQLYEGRKPGSNISIPEQLLGVRTPGGYMTNPAGTEKYLTDKRQKDWRADEKAENKRRQERGQAPLPYRQLPPP